jgi:peptide/nickel transport system substrate-binding protein
MTNIYLNSSCDQAAPGWPCDADIEALKDQFLQAKTDAERKDIAAKIQLRAFETVPYVNVVQLRAYTAYRKLVHGVLPSPVQLYWNVEKGG